MQSNLKKIGNSFGIILSKKLLDRAGITYTVKINVEAKGNSIVISSVSKRRPVNSDISTWRKQIKAAIKQGQKPEKNIWQNGLTELEQEEWTW